VSKISFYLVSVSCLLLFKINTSSTPVPTSKNKNYMIVTAENFDVLAAQVASRSEDVHVKPLDDRVIKAFYGTNAAVMSDLWERCRRPCKTEPKHLLWALMYMKLYCPEDVMAILCSTSKNTLSKWVWLWIEAIADLSVEVILWENRLRNAPQGVWCLVSVDGTDFSIQEPSPFNKKWMTPKLKCAGLKYEVGISIFSGDIVWIYGPHRGAKADITIFKKKLQQFLCKGEMVEADKGYRGLGEFIRTPHDCEDLGEWLEKSDIRARHETINHRFKVFSILSQKFRVKDRSKHELVFRSIATIVQLHIDHGHVPFCVEPKTKKRSTTTIEAHRPTWDGQPPFTTVRPE
jgi:hypothetical protein